MRMNHTLMAALFAATLALPAFAQTTPTVTTPAVTAPAVTAPAVKAPTVTAPAVTAPAVTAPTAPSAPAVPAVKPVTKPATPAKPMAGPMSINTATAPELMKLPGIGKSRSAAIIKGRPYKSVDEIDTKKIIPHATYEKIKGQFTL